ncbi:putative Neuropeptide Y receptor type 1 [Hypsibius exemplaris]|uniref:Neuropeptide Y receptor type 1 n=1 Tax=Hypsibius exemplaris TaxID=2072580 RepID=A0A1W0XDR9_HYPEX|nr:putative Neuropeptide Y receptor type 1 [Hypsibius exemplaris]
MSSANPLNDSRHNDTIFLMQDGSGLEIYSRTNIIHHPAVMGAICALYLLIIICGISGNGLVVFVVARKKAMRTVINLFIASLAVNDLVICMFAIPATTLYTFLEGWHFGAFTCKTVPLIQAASVYVSTWTLTAIAIMRFYVVCMPGSHQHTCKSACLIIGTIWILAVGICTPYAVHMKYSTGDRGGGPRCDEDWQSFAKRSFGIFSLAVQYAVPLCIIFFCYLAVFIRLRSAAAEGLKSCQSKGGESCPIRQQRVNRMLIAMVVIFGCCWLPLNLINVLNDFFSSAIVDWDYFVLVFFLSHILAVSSTCYNPVLYGWMNENFRKEFKALSPTFSCTKARRVHRQSCASDTESTCL